MIPYGEKAIKPKWFDMNNNMPDSAGEYICYYKGGSINVYHWTGSIWTWDGVPVEGLTHWMLLPEPPLLTPKN